MDETNPTPDSGDEVVHTYTIDPKMVWATPVGKEIKIYLNENETITFSREAANALYSLLIRFMSEEKRPKHRGHDLIGERFGRWTVIGMQIKTKNKVKNQAPYKWLCRCDCGTVKYLPTGTLMNGSSKSCGCYCIDKVTTHGHSQTYEYRLWSLAKVRAADKGIEFDITWDDIKIPEKCPILDVPFDLIKAIKKRGPRPYSPSLDRKDPTRGYTKDNVWVISHRANTFKSDLTLPNLKTALIKIIELLEKP